MSRPRALANQEQQAQANRLRRLGRSAILLLATLMSFATLLLIFADQLYRPDTFAIDQLKIKGNFRYLRPQQIETVVKQQAIGNFFSVELDLIKKNIEKMPLVQSADVRREWPGTLSIKVAEQRPVMRWQQDRWVNSRGEVIDLPQQVSLDRPIVLSGNEKDAARMLQQAYRWNKQLAGSDLELTGLTLSDSQSFVVRLRYAATGSEFKLMLGRHQVQQRLERFLTLFDHQYRQSGERLISADARYPDGLAIRSEVTSATEAEELAVNQSNRFLNR